MQDFMLQDWTTLDGGSNITFVQDRTAWLDVGPHSDIVFFLEVRSVKGSVALRYQTGPAIDDTLFSTAASATLVSATSPLVTKVQLATNPTVPLARLVRWKLEPLDGNPWSATFRVWAVTGKGSEAPPTPAGLPLTAWWRAAYTGSPWTGSTSAGGSGSQGLSEATNPPSVGATLNGFGTADFDGTNDIQTSASAASTYCTTTNFSGWALVNIDAINTNDVSAAPSGNDSIFSTSGTNQHFLYLRSAGPTVGMYIFPVADRKVETGVATGAWQLVQFRGDGTNIYIRVNSGSWVSATGGTINSLAAVYKVGLNTAVTQFFDGRLAELAFSQSFFNDQTFDEIKSYINLRYGLSL